MSIRAVDTPHMSFTPEQAKALDAVMDRCADALNKEDARHNRKSKRIKRKFSRQYKALIEKMIGGAQ